jgi:hypothetical protein
MKRVAVFIAVLMSLILAWSALARSQPADTYSITWYTIDGGGGTSGNGNNSLQGTIGQPDAGTLSDETYTLVGGFWGGTVVPYRTLLPLLLKSA